MCVCVCVCVCACVWVAEQLVHPTAMTARMTPLWQDRFVMMVAASQVMPRRKTAPVDVCYTIISHNVFELLMDLIIL